MQKPEAFLINKTYQLSGVKPDDSRVYYDTDYHSGGYPYWTDSSKRAKTFDVLDKVPSVRGDDYMVTGMKAIEVLEVTTYAKVISTSDLVSVARAKAEVEIAEIEKQLAAKIAALKGIK